MENFASAALRHWNDALLLESDNRVGNADHHFGFAAECALKSVLAKLPAFTRTGELSPEYKLHINALWDKVGHQSLQKTYPGLFSILKTPNAYAHWDVKQRYFAEGTVSFTAMAAHRKMAAKLLGAANLSAERRP